MTDMIAAEPELARRLIARLNGPGPAAELAAAIRATITAGDPVVVTGCGTSEHGALASVEILREAANAASLERREHHVRTGLRAVARPSDAAGSSSVSPTRGRRAPRTRRSPRRGTAGADTAVVTVSDRSPAAASARIVVETGELDQGWCHTVGYLSPILAASAVGAHLAGRRLEPGRSPASWSAGHATRPVRSGSPGALADAAHLLVIASGADRPAGRELVLKVEEASWLPSAFRDLETFLHGHLPATDPTTRARPDPHRSRPAGRAGRPGSPGARGGQGRRPAGRRHRVERDRRRARQGVDAGRSVARPRRTAAPAGRRARRNGRAAAAPDRAPGAGARHEPRPHPPRRPRLSGRRGSCRRLIRRPIGRPRVRPVRRAPRRSRRSCRGPTAGSPGA